MVIRISHPPDFSEFVDPRSVSSLITAGLIFLLSLNITLHALARNRSIPLFCG
jgi:hypothetical protein